MISLYILIKVCHQVCVFKYFIPIWDLYFHFLQCLLKTRKFILINSNLSFFVLLIAFWGGAAPEKYLSNQIKKGFLLEIVCLSFYLRSMIPFKLIFVCDAS